MHPSTTSKQRERERLKAEGWSHHELWLSPQEQEWLQLLRAPGEAFRDTIGRSRELAHFIKTQPVKQLTSQEARIVPSPDSDPPKAKTTRRPRQLTSQNPDHAHRAAIITRIRQAIDDKKKTYQQVANELNADNIPTFSGRGKWEKGNVGRFYKSNPHEERRTS
jgi:hypothetical protein